MATYAERGALAYDTTFHARVRNAAMKYALYLGPNNDETGTWALANSVISSPDHWTRQFALAVSSEPETLSGETNDPAADSDDGDTALQYAIETRVWAAFAAGLEPVVPVAPTPPA
jgi:hypothetical protein